MRQVRDEVTHDEKIQATIKTNHNRTLRWTIPDRADVLHPDKFRADDQEYLGLPMPGWQPLDISVGGHERCRRQLYRLKQAGTREGQIVERLEAGRVGDGRFATAPGSGPSAHFFVQRPCGCHLKIIGFVVRPGWEHVSVSARRRSPSWDEMCLVKDLFGIRRNA
ncbi:hypothetical protein ABIC03_007620 [Bradyrhizobium sp. RT6a]|uniref:DUF7694 domain-containing protein n=1 Tax=Bradyrhizobium sp. RT6a TaxID=3156381 RepID=UPI0033991A17